MTATVWGSGASIAAFRALVVVIALVGLFVGGVALSGAASVAHVGVQYQPLANGWDRVLEIDAGSPAERAGLRPGDVVRFATPGDRDIVERHLAGAGAHLRRRDGRVLAIVPARTAIDPRTMLEIVQGMFFALLALVIAARAWHDVQARRLSIGFLWTVFFFAQFLVAGNDALEAVTYSYDLLGPIGMGALVAFATGWHATPVRAARFLRISAVVVGAIYASANVAADVLKPPIGTPADRFLSTTQSVGWVVMAALVIAGLVGSLRFARGVERQRIGWILATFTIAFLPWMVFEPLASIGVMRLPWWIAYTTIVLPFGLGYATLRHRVVDLGFALNRAAVFAATTALLVGMFGALQWAANLFLVQATRAHDFIVQMVIAVVVLYAVRALRVRADAVVARLFFAKRQRRIEAIRALGHAIEAVESAESLAPFIVAQLRAETAIDAALYVEGDGEFVRAAGEHGPARVARDNPTVIALRAGAPVGIRAESELMGAIAFPLAVRGRLRGALVCDLPSEDEEFAPDERAALADLALRTCVVRDDLLAHALRVEIARLAEDKRALGDRILALERENVLLERLTGADEGHAPASAARLGEAGARATARRARE
jgi:hypothetical protein